MNEVSICVPYIRERGVNRLIESIMSCSDLNNLKYEILTRYDEDRIGCPLTLKNLVSESKYENVMFLADDVIVCEGVFKFSFEKMAEFVGGWGLVGLNDNFISGEKTATHWLGSKKLLPYIGGEFFHIGYKHCYCDNELVSRCSEIGRYKFADRAEIIHNHPIVQKDKKLFDGDYLRVYSKNTERQDRFLFYRRKFNNWGNSGKD